MDASARRIKINNTSTLTGIFTSNVRGFGFVTVDGMDEDLFIPEGRTGGAMYSDVVEVRLLPGFRRASSGRKRTEAEVVRIVERGLKTVVGTYQKNKGFGFVIPDNTKIPYDFHVAQKDSMGAVDGHKVVLELTDYGRGGGHPEGKIIEILGHKDDPGVDILSIIKAYNLPTDFPEDVRQEIRSIPRKVTSIPKGRENLRKTLMVTIDGESAKDLDDAVSLTQERSGIWHLGVHIADVAEYVREGSPLDQEALKRGTSIYLADRVIPMLPHELSNGICSLNQGEDRNALSVLMTFDREGRMIEHRIVESVIRVDARLSYNGVMRLLEDGDEEEILQALEKQGIFRRKTRTMAIARMLRRMKRFSAILRNQRNARGSIDFDFPEAEVTLDENGHPIRIEPHDHNTATDMIEDFMVIANETVAEHFCRENIPFLYRSHETPDPDRVKELQDYIGIYGYRLTTQDGKVTPGEVRRLLQAMRGKKEEPMLSRLTLRSMQRAHYTTDCLGHFGLAAAYYCHFTSPIRRYPDLQIHRIIKESLHGELNGTRKEHYLEILPEVAVSASNLERRADEAERETVKLKKAEYMLERLGNEYDGVISGVTGWGIYVELPDTVEGLVRISSMADDFYDFNVKRYALIGERTHRVYELGQPVRVLVSAADPLTRTVDFVLADNHFRLDSVLSSASDTAPVRSTGQEKKKSKAPGRNRAGHAGYSGAQSGSASKDKSGRKQEKGARGAERKRRHGKRSRKAHRK